MKAVHFGAGNIGRGFIGEVLAKNDFEIVFVDVNRTIIDNLNDLHRYTIAYASPEGKTLEVTNVRGINNGEDPQLVAEEIISADLITTAIGPNILKFIAPLIARGLLLRLEQNNRKPIDIIACENMIGGSQNLKELVCQNLPSEKISLLEEFVGFPNAAVDRIIPIQSHTDPLFVSVEPFSEWIVDQSQMMNKDLQLKGVVYVDDLEPYIERKLLSVNTGHSAVAYAGKEWGYETIKDAITDDRILELLKGVLDETGEFLVQKWDFDPQAHQEYKEKIVSRFKNPYISDSVDRVARTPIRKLGYNERYILPIRELFERGMTYSHLLEVVGMAFNFNHPDDEQSVQLQAMIKEQELKEVVQEITELTSDQLINEIVESVAKYQK